MKIEAVANPEEAILTYKKYFALAQAASENIHLSHNDNIDNKFYLEFSDPINQQKLKMPLLLKECPSLCDLATTLHIIIYAIEIAKTGKSTIISGGSGEDFVDTLKQIEDLENLESSLIDKIFTNKQERNEFYEKVDGILSTGVGIKR